MEKETVEYVVEQLRAVAAGLEGPSKYAYEILVRQAWTEGVVECVSAIAFLLLAVLCAFTARHGHENEESGSGDYGIPLMICSCCFGVGFVVFALINAHDGLLHLLNPGYYAIKELLGAL